MAPEERDQMIIDNIPLVHSVVKKMYLSPYVYYDKADMYQEGMIGLIDAVDRFDPDKGFAFSTYAVPMIHGQIMRFIRDNSHIMKYSRSDIDALSRINRARKTVDDLTPEDIEELEITPKNLAAIRSMIPGSLDAPISSDNDQNLGYFIADPNTPEISEELQLEIVENIKNLVISRFPETLQELLDEWYYSMAIGMKAGQHYLGHKYGFSQVHVSRTLTKFRNQFAKKLHEAGYAVPGYISKSSYKI